MQFIDLGRQQERISAQIDQRIKAVLSHGQYIMGPEIKELEAILADFAGVKHAVAVSSGTDALLIALMALGVGPGDEIITTPFTFIATGEMISLLGATPVFVDIDERTYNLSPALLETAITAKTRAVIPVSLYGQCADFDAINAILEEQNQVRCSKGLKPIAVIEDAAQSFGATYKGRKSCALSTIGCTSFFPSKPLGCYGDGGSCFTDDDDLALRMRQIIVHGQDRRYHHPIIGINGRMDTIQAAVLLAKMEIFPNEIEARSLIGDKYTQLLRDTFKTPFIEPCNTSVYAQYTIEVDNREQVQKDLAAAGIPTAVHYPVPLHLQPAFAGQNMQKGRFPKAEVAANRVMSLPMHPYLTDDEIMTIVKAVREVHA